jgi:hypothetical protein
MGLAADAATEILPDHRVPAAERLAVSDSEESCPHLLASDDHHYQGAVRHPAFDPGHRRILVPLDHPHDFLFRNRSPACCITTGFRAVASDRGIPEFALRFTTDSKYVSVAALG